MKRLLVPLLLLLVLLPVPAAEAAPLPAYRYTAKGIDAALAKRMQPSWRPGCPVPLRDLRYLTMSYVGFDGAAHTGEMVVHRDTAVKVVRVFYAHYTARFPVRRMRLVDDYAGSDDRSMAADNTSAFNCRRVEGSTSWSLHAYGRAIDLNPVENPYVRGSYVDPPAGRPYATRTPYRQGMVSGPCVQRFAAQGFGWGGSFRNSKDYQHFSIGGR